MRSRKSPDSGAGMTSPPTHQNRLPRISIPDSAQHKSALDRRLVRCRFEERFTARRMAEDYVRLYEKVIENAGRPSLAQAS